MKPPYPTFPLSTGNEKKCYPDINNFLYEHHSERRESKRNLTSMEIFFCNKKLMHPRLQNQLPYSLKIMGANCTRSKRLQPRPIEDLMKYDVESTVEDMAIENVNKSLHARIPSWILDEMSEGEQL